jgi:hypothetical protein
MNHPPFFSTPYSHTPLGLCTRDTANISESLQFDIYQASTKKLTSLLDKYWNRMLMELIEEEHDVMEEEALQEGLSDEDQVEGLLGSEARPDDSDDPLTDLEIFGPDPEWDMII